MHLPSTKDLRAFELVARLGSMRAAADEMHLTPSALSRRIQSLEEELGQALFIRDARGLTLTEAGHNYANQLRGVFRTLEEATSSVKQSKKQRLKIVAPSFVISAIVTGLDALEKGLPNIEIELQEQTLCLSSDLTIPDADIVFSWGEGQWPGWESMHITPRSYIVPVCSPRLLKNGRTLNTDEVSQHTWLIAAHFEDGWKRWYDALGEPFPKAANVIKISNGQMAGEAAAHGHGLMMTLGFGRFPPVAIMLGSLTNAHDFHALTPGFGIHMHSRAQSQNQGIAQFKHVFFAEFWNANGLQSILKRLQSRQTK